MDLTINHTTHYTYDQPAIYALQKVRLRPQSDPMQTVNSWDVTVDGGTHEVSYRDHYGNHVDLISTNPGSKQLTIAAKGNVTTHDLAGVLGMHYGRAPLWHFGQSTALTEAGEHAKQLAQILDGQNDMVDALHRLSAAILDAVPYKTGKTNADTTAEEALVVGQGVCQDHTNIMLAATRVFGMPGRYVSGYLMLDDRIDQDASHAWAEIHIDGLGWVGFDVSNGMSPDDRYVKLAVGRDASDAAPLSGLRIGASDETLIVSLQVQQ